MLEILLLFGMLLLGIILIGLDFFIPSAGLLSFTGIVAIGASFYLVYRASDGFMLAGFMGFTAFVLPYIIKKGLNNISMNKSLDVEGGFVGVAEDKSLLGKQGVAMTALRPSGTIKIADKRIDAVSDSVFIEKDSVVYITKVEGNTVFVSLVILADTAEDKVG